MIKIQRSGKPDKIFLEISDFPYASSLSTEAYNHLKTSLEDDLERFHRQQRYIAMMMARQNKCAKKSK